MYWEEKKKREEREFYINFILFNNLLFKCLLFVIFLNRNFKMRFSVSLDLLALVQFLEIFLPSFLPDLRLVSSVTTPSASASASPRHWATPRRRRCSQEDSCTGWYFATPISPKWFWFWQLGSSVSWCCTPTTLCSQLALGVKRLRIYK